MAGGKALRHDKEPLCAFHAVVRREVKEAFGTAAMRPEQRQVHYTLISYKRPVAAVVRPYSSVALGSAQRHTRANPSRRSCAGAALEDFGTGLEGRPQEEDTAQD